MKNRFGASLLAAIFAMCGAQAALAQAGPAGYWKGDDGAAPSTAADSSGFNNNGFYLSGATTSATVPALMFANPSSFSFTTAGATVNAAGFSWPTGGPVTVAFWNNVTSAQVRNSSAFSVGNTDTPNRFQSHCPWSDSNVYWDYGDLGTTGRISTSYAAYLNKWTHVALVSEGVGGAFKAIYLDGVVAISTASSDGPKTALNGVNIGRWPGTNLDHQGLIDDYRIYNRVLTPAQIAALAAGQTELPAPTGLTAAQGLNYGEIQLNWTATPTATSYVLMRGVASGGPYTTSIPVSGTSYLDTGLANNTTYFYVISAVGALGQGTNSSQAGATTRALPPRTQKVGNDSGRCGCGSITPPAGWSISVLVLILGISFALWRPSAR